MTTEGLFRRSRTTPAEGNDWTIALAGGEGNRLADYVQHRFGQRMPKQFCKLLGQRSMLEHTLDRMNQHTPASRTLTIIGPDHQRWATPQLQGRCDHVFRQPSSRETGTALYVALAMLQRWSPGAIVTVTPTDHYVAPASRYVAEVARARAFAGQARDKVVLIGARPNEADSELGYVSPGASTERGVHQVAAFVEKPNAQRASELVAGGALWNTMVCCGSVQAFWELGRAGAPQLIELLEYLVPLIETDDEDAALTAVYSLAPVVGFSREILERSPERLLALALDGVEWNDWGRADRIEATLSRRRARAVPALHALPIASAS
ncbi:MAG TPA: sugar phosphate nucleotidyltransferase [Kofleriaceae bacterium]|nr:sugar phosphate nucleotidyltransferase [Kofleriaceae bacterium]